MCRKTVALSCWAIILVLVTVRMTVAHSFILKCSLSTMVSALGLYPSGWGFESLSEHILFQKLCNYEIIHYLCVLNLNT